VNTTVTSNRGEFVAGLLRLDDENPAGTLLVRFDNFC
jgi:hypothetical protein